MKQRLMPMATDFLCTSLFQAPVGSAELRESKHEKKKKTKTKTKQNKRKQKRRKNGRKQDRSFFLEEAIYAHNMDLDRNKYTRTYSNTNTC